METKNIKDLIVSRIITDMNENGMQISEETMAIIGSDMVAGASQRSLDAVRDWFNRKKRCQITRKRTKEICWCCGQPPVPNCHKRC